MSDSAGKANHNTAEVHTQLFSTHSNQQQTSKKTHLIPPMDISTPEGRQAFAGKILRYAEQLRSNNSAGFASFEAERRVTVIETLHDIDAMLLSDRGDYVADLLRRRTVEVGEAFEVYQYERHQPSSYVDLLRAQAEISLSLTQQLPGTWVEYRNQLGYPFNRLPVASVNNSVNTSTNCVHNKPGAEKPAVVMWSSTTNPTTPSNVGPNSRASGNISVRKKQVNKEDLSAIHIPLKYEGKHPVYCHEYREKAKGWKLVSPYPNMVAGNRFVKVEGNDHFDQEKFLTLMYRNEDGSTEVEIREPPKDWTDKAEVDNINKLAQQAIRRFLNGVGSRVERERYGDDEINFIVAYIKNTDSKYDWKKLSEKGAHVTGLMEALNDEFGGKGRQVHGILNKLQRHPKLLEARGIDGVKLERAKRNIEEKNTRKNQRVKDRTELKRKNLGEKLDELNPQKKRKMAEADEEPEGDYTPQELQVVEILLLMRTGS